jgi:hypothetical protein
MDGVLDKVLLGQIEGLLGDFDVETGWFPVPNRTALSVYWKQTSGARGHGQLYYGLKSDLRWRLVYDSFNRTAKVYYRSQIRSERKRVDHIVRRAKLGNAHPTVEECGECLRSLPVIPRNLVYSLTEIEADVCLLCGWPL